jgi:superfamily II DNA or RNA helicase
MKIETSTPPPLSQVMLWVENDRTQVSGADPNILQALDRCLRFPTQIAQAKEQGHTYLGEDITWDGWVRLLHIPKTILPWFPTGLLAQVSNLLTSWSIPYQVRDQRVRPEDGLPEPATIPLRNYQEEAVREAIDSGQGVLDMPPRSGKTRIAVELVRKLGLPTVYIAPTDGIVTQTLSVFESFLGANYAFHLIGSNWEPSRKSPVVLCTAATAAMLPAEFYETRQVILVDEFHHAASASYKQIFAFCRHIYYRYGMTGTFFRSGTDAMAMHALLSHTIFRVTAREMLDRGYLVPTNVLFCPVDTKHLRGVSGMGFTQGHGRAGIHENQDRNFLVARIARYLHEQGRRVLVLVGTREQGRQVARALSDDLTLQKRRGAQFNRVEFIHAQRPRPIIQAVLASFQEGQEVGILIGTSLIGEGIDIPEADALVYARGEHAAVTLRQFSYRVCTATPGKKRALLVDFADRHHRKLMEHSQDRLRLFYEEPTFQVDVAESEVDLYRRISSLAW